MDWKISGPRQNLSYDRKLQISRIYHPFFVRLRVDRVQQPRALFLLSFTLKIDTFHCYKGRTGHIHYIITSRKQLAIYVFCFKNLRGVLLFGSAAELHLLATRLYQ